MAKPLRVGSEADEELLAAARWYDQRRPGLGKEIRILAFAHTSRRPGYWRDR